MPGVTRTRPLVVYWDNSPAPYTIERFNLLADRGNIDFVVWFARRTDYAHNWDVNEASWRFRGEYVEDPSAGPAAAHRFIRRCKAIRPDLILMLHGERPFVAGMPLIKAQGIPISVQVLPTYDAWIRRAWWKELAKHAIFRSVDAAKTAGPEGQKQWQRYGLPAERFFHVRQSIDFDRHAVVRPEGERTALRARLGLDGCVFLYVGRFWEGKGVSTLLEAYRAARLANPHMSLLLVGGGPQEASLRRQAEGIPGVVFHPFVQTAELPKYYAAADVFVFPTLGDPHGHVVEEAQAARLPIIATSEAGEIRSRVMEEESGFIVPPRDSGALSARMLALASDPALRAAMGGRGYEHAATLDHGTWAADFERFVAAALALPRRSTLAARTMWAAGAVAFGAVGLVALARAMRPRSRGL